MSLTPPPPRRRLLAAAVAAVASLATAASAAGDPVVMAAGDVARGSGSKHKYTSELILKQEASDRLDGVLALGDLAYESGTLSEFMSPGGYNDTWGRFVSKTFPAPGNHEYGTSGAKGYFDYFKSKGIRTGKGDSVTLRDGTTITTDGWYSFDIGDWHFVSLNSSNDCSPVSCKAGSAQERWLRDDLARTSKSCIGAYWHHPYGGSGKTVDLWKALADAKADIVLAGHIHVYKRFSVRDGIQEFTVGTGGEGSGAVMKLTLHSASYDFTMVGNESDSGSRMCNPKGSLPEPSPSPSPQPPPPPPPPPSPQPQPPPPPPAPGVVVVQDTQASSGSPNGTFGNDKTFRVKTKSGGGYRSFLQFTISDLSGTITGATLRLKATKGSTSKGMAVYLVDNMLLGTSTPWTESNLTWNTMPELGSRKIGSVSNVDAKKNGGVVTVTLDPGAFHANDTFSLALYGASSDSLYFSSKEGSSSGRPQLTVSTSRKSRRIASAAWWRGR